MATADYVGPGIRPRGAPPQSSPRRVPGMSLGRRLTRRIRGGAQAGTDAEPRDYVEWHDKYDQPGSSMHLRLLVVQDLIGAALDERAPGPIRVLSMCAGQGRDLVTVARRHRRGADITGRLIEIDPRSVRDARRAIAEAGLQGWEVVEADAGRSD